MKLRLKELIIKNVRINNGISNIKMLTSIMSELGPLGFTTSEYHEVIEELLRDKEIQRLEFFDPESPSGAKSVLFMKGTNFLNLTDFIATQENTLDAQKLGASETELANKSGSNI